MSRIAARQWASLPSSPYTGRRGSSSSTSDGWWEHVVPEGQLAERLRKAHEAQQAFSTSTGVSPSKRERGGTVTANTSSSSNRLAVPAPRGGVSFVTFPSRGPTDADDSSIRSMDSRASSTVGSVSSMKTNYDQAYKSSKGKSSSGSPHKTRTGGNSRKGQTTVPSNESIPPIALGLSTGTRRRPSTSSSLPQVSAKSRAFPSLSAYDSRSPLSTTPEVSSGSEADEANQRDRRRTRSALSLSAMNPTTSTSTSQRPSSSASTSSQVSQTSFHSSLSRGSGRAASRKVNFDLHREDYTRSEDEALQQRSSYSLPSRKSASPFLTASRDNGLQGQHQSRPRVSSFTTVSTRRSVDAGPSHLPSAAESLAASGAQHWFNSSTSTTMSRRRTRTLSRDGFGGQQMTMSTTTHRPASGGSSAPTSRRGSVQMNGADIDRVQETSAGRGGPGSGRASQVSHPAYPVSLDLQHLDFTRSLQSAQNSVMRTTSNALEFSRSLLAVPGPLLRPLLHFTLIWCVTGATVMALVGCLMMSFFLTAWDDVGVRGMSIRTAGTSSPSSRPSSPTTSGGCTPGTTTTTSSSRRSSATMDLTRHALDHLVLFPLAYAAKVPIAVAKSFTPSMVESTSSRRSSFATAEGMGGGAGNSAAYAQAHSHPHSSKRGGSDGPSFVGSVTSTNSTSHSSPPPPPPQMDLPPRPPLSSLIPTMLLTILIAVGAGLVGGWVKKYSKPTGRSSTGMTTEHEPSAEEDEEMDEEADV